MNEDLKIVFVTAPRDKGALLAKEILEKRLAACVNVTNTVSYYWWNDKIEEDEEVLLIIKTRKQLFSELMEFIKKVHPYEVPEILAVNVCNGNPEYISWVIKETAPRTLE